MAERINGDNSKESLKVYAKILVEEALNRGLNPFTKETREVMLAQSIQDNPDILPVGKNGVSDLPSKPLENNVIDSRFRFSF